MLLEASPEPLVSPLEEECLYAESFDKCCEIIRILSAPKKNVFLYICLFLQELLKHNQYNRLDAAKLGKWMIGLMASLVTQLIVYLVHRQRIFLVESFYVGTAAHPSPISGHCLRRIEMIVEQFFY